MVALRKYFNDFTEIGQNTSLDSYDSGQTDFRTGTDYLSKIDYVGVYNYINSKIDTPLAMITLTPVQQTTLYKDLLSTGWIYARKCLNWHSSHNGDPAISFYYKLDQTKECNNNNLLKLDDCRSYSDHRSQSFTCGMGLFNYPKDNFIRDKKTHKYFSLIRIPKVNLKEAQEYIESFLGVVENKNLTPNEQGMSYRFEKLCETQAAEYYINGWEPNEWGSVIERKHWGP